MPASAAQITANRENARSSTGPRTPEGISNSKFNATRHGLSSREIVIKGEDAAAYDDLRQSVFAAWNPANAQEAMFAEQVSINWWKKLRAERVETKLIDELGPEACFLDDKAAKKWNAFLRHRNAIERSWRYAYGELKRLVTLRQKAAALRASNPFGFDLSDDREQSPSLSSAHPKSEQKAAASSTPTGNRASQSATPA